MAKLRIKKGDTVLVITGKDKGLHRQGHRSPTRRPTASSSRASTGSRSTPRSARPQRGAKTGGIVTQEAPIHVSNVQLVVEVDGKKVGTRTGVRVDERRQPGPHRRAHR